MTETNDGAKMLEALKEIERLVVDNAFLGDDAQLNVMQLVRFVVDEAIAVAEREAMNKCTVVLVSSWLRCPA